MDATLETILSAIEARLQDDRYVGGKSYAPDTRPKSHCSGPLVSNTAAT